MKTFSWSEALRLGVADMDRDHRQIIDLMNALARACEDSAPFAELDRAFVRLNEVTARHFRDEEAYMARIGFARRDTHCQIHARLLHDLGAHYDSFRRTRHLDDKLFSFLNFWLKSHICGIDRQYVDATAAA